VCRFISVCASQTCRQAGLFFEAKELLLFQAEKAVIA